MIPKTIHYCWLSGETMPRKLRRCMDTWRRVMPDYDIKLWDTTNFDIESIPFVEEAYRCRKWAFAADYIRLWALYHEGGVYLDSDVRVLRRFDPLMNASFFSSMEYHPSQIERDGAMYMIDDDGHRVKEGYVSGTMIQAAVMGSEPRQEIVADLMRWYEGRHFIQPDGSMLTFPLAPMVYAHEAERYGFVYKDTKQELPGGIVIHRSDTFAGNRHETTEMSYAVHLCAHSWHPSPKDKLRRFLGLSS